MARIQTLTPLTKSAEPRPFIAFDIESKHDDTQQAGFSRPFLVGVFDGNQFVSFRNEPHVEKLPWAQRCYAPGGCIDKFLRYIFGETDSGRLTNPYKNTDIYAHNMGAFDGLFLPSWLVRRPRDYSFKIMPVQGRIQMMEVWRHNPSRSRDTIKKQHEADRQDKKRSGTWRFLDSYRIMPGSLQQMAKSFGFEGKIEHDLNLHERDPAWEKYLQGDCVQLYKILQRFSALIEQMGGEVGITAPSTAMKMLRKRYLKDDDPILRNLHFPDCKDAQEDRMLSREELEEIRKEKKRKPDEECPGCAHEFFRSSYFGGRTEVLDREGYGYYYDFNSSYPYSMKNFMPVGEMTVLGENEDFSKFSHDESYIGFVRCTVEIPDDCYLPPLPVQLDGKLKFPAGRFSGTWNWVELQVLKLIGGQILHVEKSVWIKGKRFLAEFVDSLYQLRQKKSPTYDKGKDKTAKIMLNSTFGKFGMEHDRQEIIIVKPGEPEPWTVRLPAESKKQWEKRRKKENWHTPDIPGTASIEHDSPVRIKDTHVDAAYIIPQIAAHITASSRMLLWHAAFQIHQRGFSLYYFDTDSILTDCPDIPHSTDLGGLKKEYPDRLYIYCYAPKMYYIEKDTPFEGEHEYLGYEDKYRRKCDKNCKGCAKFKIMMKGFPKPLRTPDTIAKLKRGEEIKFTNQERLGAIAKGAFLATPQMIEIKKSLRSKYDKRVMLDDGRTVPIALHQNDALSDNFRCIALTNYTPPSWIADAIPLQPVHPRPA